MIYTEPTVNNAHTGFCATSCLPANDCINASHTERPPQCRPRVSTLHVCITGTTLPHRPRLGDFGRFIRLNAILLKTEVVLDKMTCTTSFITTSATCRGTACLHLSLSTSIFPLLSIKFLNKEFICIHTIKISDLHRVGHPLTRRIAPVQHQPP
jgi:hypothetical protein